MLANGTCLVPTLAAPRAVLAAATAGAQPRQTVIDKAREVTDIHHTSVTAAVETGIRIAMGTDSGVGPHGHNLEELPLMQACGMSPEAVLAASTSRSAELCGLDRTTGRVAPGLAADRRVVERESLDVSNLRERLRQVWQCSELVVDHRKSDR